MKNLDIFYFSSTHWDREWYQDFQGFRYRLVKMVDKLINLFENDTEYKTFHFDGQTVVLEDYVQIRPEMAEKLKKLINARRILVGPWYVMPDEFLVSGESLIKNLMIGHENAKKWESEAWKYGYVCDIFGHIAQMPQIFNGFSIKYSLLGRGTTEDWPAFFKWQSPDGSECINYKLDVDGYGDFYREVYGSLNDTSINNPEVISRIKKYIDGETQRSDYPVVIIMDGTDHADAFERTTEYIHKIAQMYPNARIRHTNLCEQGELLEKYDDLPTIKGELNYTAQYLHGYLHLITNTLSSHYPIKKANDECQNLLEKEAEPLCAFAKLKNIPLNRSFLNLAYKYLIKNHPHDSICGCSIDRVHKDMEYRFDQVKGICTEFTQDYIYIDKRPDDINALRENNYENILTLYNTLPFNIDKTITTDLPFKPDYPSRYSEPFGYEDINCFKIYDFNGNEIPYQVVKMQRNYSLRLHNQIRESVDLHTITFRAQIPASGKSEYKIVPAKTAVRYLKKLKSGVNYAENEFIRLDISNNGTLSILNKKNGKVYNNLCNFADDGEIGDGWYHVNPICDRRVFSNGSPCTIERVEQGPSRCVFKITKYFETPAEIITNKNGKSRSEKYVTLKFIFYAGLSEESKFIDVKLSYDNIAKDHRLRMLIPTGIKEDKYFSGQAFCFIERKAGIDYSTQDWRETDQYEKSTNGIIGKRDAQKDGIAVVFANGIHECAAFDDEEGTLAVTLSRSFSTTVKTNGETKCQINIPLEYNFDISVLDSETEYSSLVKQQDILAANIHNNFVITAPGTPLAKAESLLSVSGKNAVTSIIKCSEDGKGIIVRVFNPSNEQDSAKISICQNIKKAELVNLNEEPQCEIACNKNEVNLKVEPWKIKTVKIYL